MACTLIVKVQFLAVTFNLPIPSLPTSKLSESPTASALKTCHKFILCPPSPLLPPWSALMSAWSTASTFIATVYSPHKSQPNAFKEQSKLCHSSAQNASGTSLIMQNNSEASKALILFQKDQYTVPPPLLLLTSTCFLHSSSLTHFLLLLVHPSQMPQGVRLPRPRLATTLLPQRSAWLTGPPHLNLCSEIT